MTSEPGRSLTDRIIEALRANHDKLAAFVATLSPDDLSRTSGSTEWPVAQVLSHMGSGAEIQLAGLEAALGVRAPLPNDFNQGVWDRWNAMGHAEQAASFLASNAALVDALDSLTAEQRATLPIPVGFMPAPMSITQSAGMRLNEVAQHSWDVQIAFDPAAELSTEEATLIADLLSGELGFLLGYSGHADAVSGSSTTQLSGTAFTLVVDDAVSLSSSVASPTATFAGPLPAAIRLLGGRLTPAHTPDDVTVTGNVTLDELRAVFPGN